MAVLLNCRRRCKKTKKASIPQPVGRPVTGSETKSRMLSSRATPTTVRQLESIHKATGRPKTDILASLIQAEYNRCCHP